jgi:predicted TIM-barrel fold metal-dependent hydrolase
VRIKFMKPPLLPLAVSLLILASASAALGAPARELPDKAVIDMHCHVAGMGEGGSGCFVSPALRRSYKFPFYMRSFGASLPEIQKKGDLLIAERLVRRVSQSRRVGKLVLLALDGVVDTGGALDRENTEFYVPNEYVARLASEHPEFLFGASVNPLRRDALERLDWASAHGAVLVKWLPAIQHFDPSDPRLIPFYRKLVDLDLPLLVHTGDEHAFSTADNRYSDPALLRLPASLGVKLIVAHAAQPGNYDGEDSLDRLCKLAKDYPTVYADISALTLLLKRRALPKVLRREELKGRLVYGSDFPLIEIAGINTAWAFLPQLGLKQTWKISHISNPWDRDVALKRALGVPDEVFMRIQGLFPRQRQGG